MDVMFSYRDTGGAERFRELIVGHFKEANYKVL